MPKYKFLVFTRPVQGREQEYNDWYQKVHLPDLLTVPGYTSAQRFRLSRMHTALSGEVPFPYLAIYNIETDDIDAVLAGMKRLKGKIVVSDALNLPASSAMIYEEYGPLVERES
jgi:hypothetical protein